MADHDNDIDALLRYLLTSGHTQYWNDDSTRWRAAITALVAERNALKEKAKMLDTVIGERNEYEAITNELRIQLDAARSFWRERAERRDAEQKSAADRDLRERLVCAIWPQMLRSFDQPSDDGSRYEWQALKAKARNEALDEADKMLDFMRKQGGGA